MSWLWIWLAATGLAVVLLALSALLSEPEHVPRPSATAPIAEADGVSAETARADQALAAQRDAAARDVPSDQAQALEGADEEPSEAAPESSPERPQAQEHSQTETRVTPRGPSLQALRVPMLGRQTDHAHARLHPVATANRLCTELASRRRQSPLTDSEQQAWEEHCQKL